MSANADGGDEGQCAWKSKTDEKLDQARTSKEQVRKALLDLEQKHADKMEAIAAERLRQERQAAAAAARAKREQEEKVRAEFKRQQAASLKAKKDAVRQGKKDESAALKAATANFQAAKRADHLATLRAKRIFEMQRSDSAMQNSCIACFKQYRMWYVDEKKCEMRLEAREKRPASELFVDTVQTALEKEAKVLKEARAALKQHADEGEKLCSEMAETTALLKSGSSRENVIERFSKQEATQLMQSSSAPSLPAINPKKMPERKPSAKDFMGTLTSSISAPSYEDLLEKAHELTGKAWVLAAECSQVLENCRKSCAKVTSASNVAFDQRKSEIDALRKALEQEKLDTEGSVKDASMRLTMLKMKASHHAQTQEEEDEIQAAEGLVQELQDMKVMLVEDWRCKHAAFKIDEWCRNLTPTRAATLGGNKEAPEQASSLE